MSTTRTDASITESPSPWYLEVISGLFLNKFKYLSQKYQNDILTNFHFINSKFLDVDKKIGALLNFIYQFNYRLNKYQPLKNHSIKQDFQDIFIISMIDANKINEDKYDLTFKHYDWLSSLGYSKKVLNKLERYHAALLNFDFNIDSQQKLKNIFELLNKKQIISVVQSLDRVLGSGLENIFQVERVYHVIQECIVINPAMLDIIHYACIQGCIDIVKKLVSINPDLVNQVDSNGKSPLFYAVKNNHRDIVTLLLQNGAIVNTELHVAAFFGHYKIVEILLDAGVNVNQINAYLDTPLHIAADHGRAHIVDLLLTRKADIKSKNIFDLTPVDNAIINAKSHNNAEKIEVFLRHQIPVQFYNLDVNVKQKLFFDAAIKGCINLINQLLTDPSININQEHKDGSTALHRAAENGWIDIVKLLLSHGAHVSAKNNSGTTPLHMAAKIGHDDVVQILLSAPGIDINVKDNSGDTPLHYAAFSQSSNTVVILINNGANIFIVNHKNDSPLKLAMKNNDENTNETVIKLLREAMRPNKNVNISNSRHNIWHKNTGIHKKSIQNKMQFDWSKTIRIKK
ncbi:MAG: ankyrin repeat protein [uncultured bacterium]|nr:MAG: ankyrin repeat protein [uncultured bacterium]